MKIEYCEENKRPFYDIINNVEVYGLEKSIKTSKYPMAVDILELDSELTKTAKKLATCPIGAGHDNYLNGIVVQFDLTFTNKAWIEAERYHFLDFVSSQSTMHRITKFDLDKAYISYVDPRIVDIMKEKVKLYNEVNSKLNEVKNMVATSETEKKFKDDSIKIYNELSKKRYLEVLYSNPCGFRLTAGMTTNYRQLKTIYKQRLGHRLPEWNWFCEWIESLPHSELITGKDISND